MVRRAPLLRLVASLSAVWFALYGAIGATALPCAMPHESAATAPSSDDSHAAHASHEHEQDAPSAPFHSCDCATSCCALPIAALPEGKTALSRAMAIVTLAPPGASHEAPPVERAHLLPFAHGPPV
jgi:hypothetical protein